MLEIGYGYTVTSLDDDEFIKLVDDGVRKCLSGSGAGATLVDFYPIRACILHRRSSMLNVLLNFLNSALSACMDAGDGFQAISRHCTQGSAGHGRDPLPECCEGHGTS